MKKLLSVLLFLFFTLQLTAEEIKPVSYEDQKKFDCLFMESIRLKLNNQFADAFLAIEEALNFNPYSAAGLYEISYYYTIYRKDSLALQSMRKAVAYEPDNFEYKSSLATLYREFGQYEEAASLYENLIKEHPDNAELNFSLIDLYIRLQDFDAAIRVLNEAEQNYGIREVFSIQKFRLYSQLGDEEKALDELIRLAEKYPYESKYLYVLGDVYLQQNFPEKAQEYYEKAYQLDPTDPTYVSSMVNFYRHKNDEKAINDLFAELMEQHLQDVELNRIYGSFLLSQKRWEEAKFQYQLVTEKDPEDYDAWRNLLSLAMQEINTEEVISICDGALLHFPEIPDFYYYKGVMLSLEGNYQEALAVLLDGLQYISAVSRPVASNYYGQIGDIQYQIGDKEAAYEAYDTSLEYNENNIMVLNNYAYFLSLDKQDLDKAERMSSRTIQADPDNFTYMDTYAWIFFQQGNYKLAKFYIEIAIRKGGDQSPDILEHYGDILYQAGNKDQAIIQWEKAFDLHKEEKTTLREKINNTKK